jgi:aspartyl/glutamyl-tRNA(Asn/Gln) amidotransferase C subunit
MEGGDVMRFESINEVALKWNISTRRIRTLCIENRIEGAMKVGSQWVIPSDAKKPEDLRIKTGNYRKESKEMERISVEKLHELALRLKFRMSEDEYKTLQDEFDVLLKQMELLGDIENIEEVEPMVFPFQATTLGMREDEVKDQLSKEDVLKNAAEVQNDMVKAQKVVG